MQTQTLKRPTNRGELRVLLGAERNDDGTWKIPTCKECGATRIAIVFAGKNSLAGDVTHLLEGGAIGCVTTVDAAIDHVVGPVEVVGLTEHTTEPPPPEAHDPYATVAFVQFVTPISFSTAGEGFWSRIKFSAVRISDINDRGITFAYKTEEVLVPWTNIAYIKRMPRPS